MEERTFTVYIDSDTVTGDEIENAIRQGLSGEWENLYVVE